VLDAPEFPWKEDSVLQITKSQLTQVEYLLAQSAQGNHVLFDTDTLRRIFSHEQAKNKRKPRALTEEEAYEAEPHLERLLQEPSLESKRAYLEGLDRPTLERVIRTYFSIVENNIFENAGIQH
jgi:hypothetical protein